jgi:hypothetical protein
VGLLGSRLVHLHAEVLIATHLARELILIAVRRDIHLALGHLEVLHLTLREHAHVDILLMRSSQLILLCLQEFNLLGKGELLHCRRSHVSICIQLLRMKRGMVIGDGDG